MSTTIHGARKLLLTAFLALAGAATLQAADTIKLKDGTSLKGQATDYDATTRVLSFRTEDGRDHQLSLDDLNQRSVYKVTRSEVPQDSGEGQLKLGNYARDIGLYAHAMRHYRYAKSADASLADEVAAQEAALRKSAAEWGMGNARAAIEKGDIPEAEKWLKRLIDKLPDEPQAAQAAEMLDQYYDQVRQERDDEIERQRPELLQKDLAKAKQHYDRMVEDTKKGLTQKRTGSQAVRNWESATRNGERALKELDSKAKDYSDAETVALIGQYREIVIEQIVDARMNLASHYMTRSSYNKAASEVNKALALDPNNQQARSMRVRIENASSRGIRWW